MNLGEKLRDKCVLVTGASSGLGEHFARLFASCGANVAVTGRRIERLQKLSDNLRALGAPRAAAVEMDMLDAGSIERGFGQVVEALGGVDALVNNAGIASEGDAAEMPVEEFDAVMATNLRGVWIASAAAARYWRNEKKPGTIVNIASVIGVRQARHVIAYATSKAAVVQLTKTLALEWVRDKIRVNALAPGYFKTEINAALFEGEAGHALIKRIPMRRLGRMEELDAPMLLLASDASSFMTGEVIAVDGGHLVSSL
ncbi:MAG: SDR family oxidoreductase [Beijerinckiaceae bacterium]